MPIVFGLSSFRSKMFWQFFAKFFMLILIPALLASIFTNLFVASLIEKEAEQSSNIVMSNHARQTDKEFQTLQHNMINVLSASNLRNMLAGVGSRPATMEQTEAIYTLMGQINSIITEPLVSGALLYFANNDLVIDNNIYTNKAYYFQNQYIPEASEASKLFSTFSGKRMMHFTEPYPVRLSYLSGDKPIQDSHTAIVMSYPFNSDKPDVYLAVYYKTERLQSLIQTQESWITRTAIADSKGRLISQSDSSGVNMNSVLKAMRNQSEGLFTAYDDKEAVSFVRSQFDSDWYYVSWVDMDALMKPARMLRMLSVGFLAFFLLVGAFVSYYLSRRLYTPILEIRTRLQSHQGHLFPGKVDHRGGDNDFDVIERFSKLLITEHKELSQLVKGMLPMVQEDFITRILQGEYRDNLSIEYYAKEIAFDCKPEGARTVFVIEYHYYDNVLEHWSETSKSFMLVELKEKIRNGLPADVWLSHARADVLACIVHHGDESALNLKSIALSIQSILEQYTAYFKATIGVGKTASSLGELHLSYQYSLAMLKHKKLSSEVEIISDDKPWEEQGQFDSFLSAEEVNRIANLHKAQDYGRLLQSALDLLDMGRRKQANANQMKSLCSDVLNTWIRVVESERNDFSISLYSGLFESLNRCQTWEELKQCIEHIHSLLFQSPSEKNRSDQFAEIVYYIKEHYDEELSIEAFAERMNMSVSHFSRTFKEVVGEKYVEFITKHRLSVAKQLLCETELKIEEIAERVGYLGSNAFIRIFRKYEGVTPGKYRSSR
ncbi:helix-turn-helix domain-containing protein [Paenibacillus sp. UNC451MF]|uniref:helix-turn-helix domain-containing protein n=1 Tax=Paenibacillus sp. UNC451MF TaxID=1449063 RepID=UPI00048C6414|nr:helix-turn-helix domain-containing protein [Paenibacillus sp. UNC451MF]